MINLKHFTDDLCERLSLKDLIGKNVKLTKRGQEFIGLCPFHNEKTPSFHVVERKNFYHCFGCGQHGRAIEWVMEQQNYSFKEAIEYLAPIAGMDVPIFHKQSEQEKAKRTQQEERENIYYKIMDKAACYFSKSLHDTRYDFVKNYCHERNLHHNLLSEFRIGYASGEGLMQYLLEDFKGCESYFEHLGLLRKQKNAQYYEFFRNRLIFPIQDKYGRIIGFGGRYMGDAKKDHVGKYINSPESSLFNKGKVFYNIHRISHKKNDKALVIVEGYMDAIALYGHQIEHVVAPLGTAIGEEQLRLAWRHHPSPIIAFDGDHAGMLAAYRAAMRLLPLITNEKNCRFLFLPPKEDPDSFIHKEGASSFMNLMLNSKQLFEFLWDYESKNLNANDPHILSKVEKNLQNYSAEITDKTLSTNYFRYFKDAIWRWRSNQWQKKTSPQ